MAQEINQRQGVVQQQPLHLLQQSRQMLQQYPTATITELPADSTEAAAAAATAAVEEETVEEGEDFLTPSDYVGGENYLANIAQVR